MTNNFVCLYNIPVFNNLPHDCFIAFCDASEKISLEKGRYLFHQGNDADRLYIVKSGSLKMVKVTEAGDEIVLRIVSARQAIGENNLFAQDPIHQVSAVALEDSQLCSLGRSAYEKIILENPQIAKEVIKVLGDRVTKLHMQIADQSTQSSSDKVLDILKQLGSQNGIVTDEGILINLSITHADISSMVGLSRVMTSQILKKLENEGYIVKIKRKYLLPY